MNKFAWLFCGCILALSACSEKQLGPESGTTDGPEIRFGVSEQGSGTKALIEANGLTATGSKAQLHVFDILTGFVGSVGTQTSDGTTPITYIDKTIGYLNGAWPFVVEKTENNQTVVEADTPAYYRWTKTGTHTFFGYLTKDPGGNTFTGTAKMGTGTDAKKLFVGAGTDGKTALALTPATTPQFDFLYSDIVKRNAATGPHTAIQLSMSHLFTALAVDVVNETGAETITNVSVKFTGVHPTQSATIDWSETDNTKTYPIVTYTPALADQTIANGAEMVIGSLSSVALSTDEATVTAHLLDGEYRLLWPQKILAPTENAVGSQVSVTYEGCGSARTANLSDLKDANDNPITTFEAGKKYLLTITIKPLEVLFNIIVTDLVNVNANSQSGETFYFES